jgi:nucleotide-binding universal stress UspA family protein
MKLVVATDGSRGGTAALRFAARMAACDPATDLTVITIGTQAGSSAPVVAGAKMRSDERRRAKDAMEDARRTLGRLGVEGHFRIVSPRPQDAVPEAISREADRLKADLVVIGSEGRDTLREWVLGGVALRLIYVARRPVAVVRPPRQRRRA